VCFIVILLLPLPTFSFKECQLLLHQTPIRIKAMGWRKFPLLNSDCERRDLRDLREQSIVLAIRAPSVLIDGPENRRFHAVSKRVSQAHGSLTSFVMAHGLGSNAEDNVMLGWKGRPIKFLVSPVTHRAQPFQPRHQANILASSKGALSRMI
jgi:hypothetical protein